MARSSLTRIAGVLCVSSAALALPAGALAHHDPDHRGLLPRIEFVHPFPGPEPYQDVTEVGPPAPPEVSIARNARVIRRTVRIRVSCMPALEMGCRGTLRLRGLGRARFSTNGDDATVARVPLARRTAARLRRRGSARVTATATAWDAGGTAGRGRALVLVR